MAEQHDSMTSPNKPEAETKNRSFFDCFGKKEETSQEDVVMIASEQKPTLMEKLHRTHSSSLSSSEEEVEEGGVKIRRRKKKDFKEKEKVEDDKVAEYKYTANPVGCDQVMTAEPEEKKGILEKIKEKMPGHHKKDEEIAHTAPTHCSADGHCPEGEPKEKKGILEKIKEKLPGSPKDVEEGKEH
ncbi:hypothetical protein Ancab_017289 [Ancistrocladus abbreviatus]